jgi:hypothetical protein
MVRMLVVIVVAAALVPSDAEACSCVKRSFKEHAKTEKRVLLARAGKPVKTGDALKQTFTVLATMKGPAEAQFTLDRAATPPCAASYADGEVAILFTSGGDLDPCHGNVPLATQIDELADILAGAGSKLEAIKPEALEAALREVLPKYLHDRPKVVVRHAPFAGTSFDIGKSRLSYAKTAAVSKDVDIKIALASDGIAFVEGTYGAEGLRFKVLLHLDKTWSIARSWVAEK